MKAVSYSTGTEAMRGEQPAGGIRFDGIVIALCSWLRIGTYLDGWAHNHIPELETFFTPWHGILYSGFFALAVFLGVNLFKNRARGYPWKRALPTGYELSLLGVFIFIAGGVGDLIWHELFGIEADLEALLSPTHLILALGTALIVSGPLRAAWRRPDPQRPSWAAQLPMLLSLTYLLSGFTFMTQFAHPLLLTWAAKGNHPNALLLNPPPLPTLKYMAFFEQAVGVLSILLQTGLLMGLILLVVGRWGWKLPWGGLTLVFALNAIGMTWMAPDPYLTTGPYPLIAVAILAGLAADLLLQRLKPSVTRPVALRLFALAVPTLFYLLYFLALRLRGGIWWPVHVWAGTTVLAGIVGWMLSYLLVPPSTPSSDPFST